MHQQSHLRFRWNRIFKRFHHDDENRQQTNNVNTEEDRKYPQRITRRLRNNIEDENDQSHSKLSPSFESLPFADPSLTKAAFSDENLSFDQEKFIEQKEFCSTSSSPTDKLHSQSIERTSMINPNDDESEQSWPMISFADSRRFSSRLRRLQNKSKVRPVTTFNKDNKFQNSSVSSSVTSPKRSSISSSIARRIEMLKEAAQYTQKDSIKPSKEDMKNIKSICKMNHQSTQTCEQRLNSTVFHSIHYHYLHHLPCLSMIGTISLMLFFIIEILIVFL